MKTRVRQALLVLLVAATAAAGGCSLLGSDDQGTLRVFLTDAPFPFDLVAEANVTISRVEILGTDDVPRVVLDDTTSYNLLTLRDSVRALLGEVELEEGAYHQVRLIVDRAEVKLTDDRTFPLTVPSGEETGVKILLRDFEIVAGETQELTLDFDVSESFLVRGSAASLAEVDGFSFKPVIKPIGFETEEVAEAAD